MQKKIIWLFLAFLIVFSLVLASCAPATPTTPSTPTTPTTPSTPTTPTTPTTTTPPARTGKWWDKFGEPQYGGRFTFRLSTAPGIFDPYYGREDTGLNYVYYESLAMLDWTLDRNVYSYKIDDIPPEYKVGRLVETWEQPDLQTIVFHVRKGIHWQDKPPVNGREFTAYDIEWSWHRNLGLGSGFTKPSTYIGATTWAIVESITATDKYTVVFKAKSPTISMLEVVIDEINTQILPREAVTQWGDLKDWRHVIGTGPFILEDFVSGSSITLAKNTNYWGYDERYPKNRLPYADDVHVLIIPDEATALAALRTGKIDLIGGRASEQLSWERVQNLAKTNPEILTSSLRASGARGFQIRCDKKPFTDIRVRKAMQMAIDLKSIAATHYGGTVDGIPYGLIGPDRGAYYTPFETWPKEVQEGYMYNPAGARQLLAAAGYPNGFKTNVVAATSEDTDLVQIIKAYFADIGIDLEIKLMDPTAWRTFAMTNAAHDAMAMYHTGAYAYKPLQSLRQRLSTHTTNMTHNNDAVYDTTFKKAEASLNLDEQKQLIKEADAYATAQQWVVNLVPAVSFNVYQPWWKGYSGEALDRYNGAVWARTWIDQELKKAAK